MVEEEAKEVEDKALEGEEKPADEKVPEAAGKPADKKAPASEAPEKPPMWAWAAILLVSLMIIFLSYQYYYPSPALEVTTTSTLASTTTSFLTTTSSSSTSSSTSTSTTLSVVSVSSHVFISGYQTESPYKPDKRYLHEEWVELRNTGETVVNLEGWRIRNKNYKKTMELPEFYLYPGQSVKVHTGSGWPDGKNIYMGLRDEFWDNDVDVIAVFDANQTLVEKLRAMGRLEYSID